MGLTHLGKSAQLPVDSRQLLFEAARAGRCKNVDCRMCAPGAHLARQYGYLVHRPRMAAGARSCNRPTTLALVWSRGLCTSENERRACTADMVCNIPILSHGLHAHPTRRTRVPSRACRRSAVLSAPATRRRPGPTGGIQGGVARACFREALCSMRRRRAFISSLREIEGGLTHEGCQGFVRRLGQGALACGMGPQYRSACHNALSSQSKDRDGEEQSVRLRDLRTI